MIVRQAIQPLGRHCGVLFRLYGGQKQQRYASVSTQILRPAPEKTPRTDYIEKYQEKLERKAKELSPPIRD
jgi:hypothetical protein